jgi:putative nucleotidyltransferase with HDIG domain
VQDPAEKTLDSIARAAARLAGKRFANRALGALLVLGVTAASAWLLSPGSTTQRMPGDDALGTPAVGTIKAARDYDIPDEEATSHRREETAATERPVYDHDDGALEETAARIRGAFQLMRDAQAPWHPRAGRRRDAQPEQADLRQVFASQRDAFVSRLQSVVADEDFAALEEARFSEQAEQLLVSLVTQGLAGKVVEDRKLLPADRERGLVSREMRGGTPQGEHVVVDLALIRDLEQARQDVARAGAGLPFSLPRRLRAALMRVAVSLVRPTLVLDQAETLRRQREAAERVKPVVIPIKRGEKIIGDGERIEKRHLVIFRGIRAQTHPLDRAAVRVGGGVLVLVLVLLLWRYARRNVGAFRPAPKDAVLLAVLYTGMLALASAGLTIGDALHDRFPALPPETFYYLVPFAVGAMLVRSVLSAEIALLFSIALGAAVGLLAGHSIFFAGQASLTSVAASGLAARTRGRRGYVSAGMAVGALGALLVLATYLFTGRVLETGAGLRTFGELLASMAAAFLSSALLLPTLVLGLLPLVEGAFGYVTDMKLLGLANLNHPALKELIVQAPGTYHHSIIMGALAESAAEAIGANVLLAKVSAYYHDIGKIRNPLYFAENQRGENKHEQLAASMSALIVKRHVTDGLELAAHWRIPEVVADVMLQHHGTRFVSFFWAKAQEAAQDEQAAGPDALHATGEPEGGGQAEPVGPSSTTSALDESLYRYGGPKPQTREAALVMIADTCEASARALPDPSPERIHALVHKRVNEVFSEGQLDECDLTLKDLNAVAAAMSRALEAVYHSRPAYPTRPSTDRDKPVPVQLVAKR